MKVLLVTQQTIPHDGGLSTHLLDLRSGLIERGHTVRLVHGGQAFGPSWTRLLRAALVLGHPDLYRRGQLVGQVKRLGARVSAEVKALQPDILHCHDPCAGFCIAAELPDHPFPVVETVHGPLLYEYRQAAGWPPHPRCEAFILHCEQAAFANADAFIAVDSGQAAILRNDYGVDGERIAVVFNAVNVEAVRTAAQAATTLVPDEP